MGSALGAESTPSWRRRPGVPGGEALAKLQDETAAEARAIAADAELSSWEPRLRRLVARHADGDLQDEALFAPLPILRDKLLLAARQPSWQEKDHRGVSLGARARYLIALAGDGRDDALLAVVLKESPFMHRAPSGIAGKTMHEALERWREHHFVREGVTDPSKRTANHFTVLSEDDHRALVEHYVRYRHWAYSQTLVLRCDRGRWIATMVIKGVTQHLPIARP